MVKSPSELRARWLRQEQRQEIEERLVAEGIDLKRLAAILHLSEADPFDLLLYVAFGQPALTRQERADRLRQEEAAFFERYSPAAREILYIIVTKYANGETEDVGNTELLKVPPLREQGTFMELSGQFGGGTKLREALGELRELLYKL